MNKHLSRSYFNLLLIVGFAAFFLSTLGHIFFGINILPTLNLSDASIGLSWLMLKYKANADTIHKFALTSGVVVGGISAYFKFFRGQTLSPKIEIKVSCEVVEVDDITALKIRVEAKNAGSTSFHFGDLNLEPPDRCHYHQNIWFRCKANWKRGLDKSSWHSETKGVVVIRQGKFVQQQKPCYEVEWADTFAKNDPNYKKPICLGLFKQHQWIRVGETIADELLVGLLEPLPQICEVSTDMASRSSIFNLNGEVWLSTTIFNIQKPDNKGEHDQKNEPFRSQFRSPTL